MESCHYSSDVDVQIKLLQDGIAQTTDHLREGGQTTAFCLPLCLWLWFYRGSASRLLNQLVSFAVLQQGPAGMGLPAEMLDALMNDDTSPFMNQPMIKTMRRELTAMLTKQHEATGHMHLPNTRTIDASNTSADASKLAEVRFVDYYPTRWP
jgi:hypothetical protein